MAFKILKNNIVEMETDIIVNAANSGLWMGGGVCGAIFRAAGAQNLQETCRRIGYCDIGDAVITEGFCLKAKYIIHTVGPIWNGGKMGEEKLLKNCYIHSLELAQRCQCKSIAFPLISAGTYGYPPAQALEIAVRTILEYLREHSMEVYLVLVEPEKFMLAEKLFGDYVEKTE